MMPQTVAVESTTARVVPEPRALVKGSDEMRMTTVKVEKMMEDSEIFFMYGSLVEREILKGAMKVFQFLLFLCVATLDTRILSLNFF